MTGNGESPTTPNPRSWEHAKRDNPGERRRKRRAPAVNPRPVGDPNDPQPLVRGGRGHPDTAAPYPDRPYRHEIRREDRRGGELSPRASALHLMMMWDSRKNISIEGLLKGLFKAVEIEPSERRFIAQLCYGSVRLRGTLRFISERMLNQPLSRHPRTVRAALSLGLYQAVYLRTPDHAVVDTTIDAWRAIAGGEIRGFEEKRWSGVLNAVLRRVCSRIQRLSTDVEDPDDAVWTPEGWCRLQKLGLPSAKENAALRLGIQFGHPAEMVRLWLDRFDLETLRAMMKRNNDPPPLYLILRQPLAVADQLERLRETGIEASEVTSDPRAVEVLRPGAIEALPGFDGGDFWVQDVSARRLALMMPERVGCRLLDLCCAPGGKLATLLDRGKFSSVLAVDVSDRKLRLVVENLERLRLSDRPVRLLETSREATLRVDENFDQILVDAPCSNSGVFNRRHEARWRFLPEVLRGLEGIQLGLLRSAVRHLAADGDLLYTTCSIEPAENSAIVHALLRQEPDLRLVEEVEILPGDGGGDGGYGALLKRSGGL